MPSQFQLRDLVNHLLVGAVLLLLSLLFCFLLSPPTWRGVAEKWPEISSRLGAGLLIPIALFISYTVGAVMPNSPVLGGDPKRWLPCALQYLRIIKKPEYVEPSIVNSAVPAIFAAQARTLFTSLNPLDVKEDEDLFRLASAQVLSAPSSLQQLDIERHFILKHLNAKLCALFFFSFMLSLLGAVESVARILAGCPSSDTRLVPFALLVLVFYSTARASGRKAQKNEAYWRILIMQSFVVGTLPRLTTPPRRPIVPG